MSEFEGQSLRYIRTLKGDPPQYASAKEAYETQRIHQGEPSVGAYVWLKGGIYGDVGLYLGMSKVLVLIDGVPMVATDLSDRVLGWSP